MPISQGKRADGSQGDISLGYPFNEQLASEVHGRYYVLVSKGLIFVAHAIVTAPVIYSTAAGTGGPLLWNPPGSGVNAELLCVSFGTTVVTTVAAALGITYNSTPGVQNVAPTATTAIDSSGNTKVGGAASKCSSYRVGTVATAGNVFIPFAQVHTGALTVDTTGVEFIDLSGLVLVPPGSFASVAASATATTLVAQIALFWAEIPIPAVA